ncbi:hypothetical protein Q7P37_005488 [Cladosporium fusiforme]
MSSPESTPAALEFPPPPSTEDTKSDLTSTIAWLKTNIAAVYLAARTSQSQGKPPRLSRGAYLGLYSTTHDYSMATKAARKPPTGEDLYRCLESEIRTHCQEVRVHAFAASESLTADSARRVVQQYLDQWNGLTQLAALVTHLLQPLEREWITRSIAEKRANVNSIKHLHTIVWKDEMFPAGLDSIVSAMEMLQKQGEDGSDGDRALVKQFLQSLRSIGGPEGLR